MKALVICNTQIRRDPAGRYCLNDLHQASGGAARHQPPRWVRLDQTKELIAELRGDRYPEMGSGAALDEPLVAIEGGLGQGTYAIKELVYAYAMWISPKFHLHVIRAYDALQHARRESRETGLTGPSNHADMLVGASRGFGALVRAGRLMGLSRAQAVRAANAATLRATGVDLVDEMGASEATEQVSAARAPAPDDAIALFHQAMQAGELGVPYQPCLSRDAFYLYQHWCRETGHMAEHLPRFVQRLRVEQGVHIDRKRYSAEGSVWGPASMLLWGTIPSSAGSEASALGVSVMTFQHAVSQVLRGNHAAPSSRRAT